MKDEDVQIVWNLLSLDIDNDDDCQALLKEVQCGAVGDNPWVRNDILLDGAIQSSHSRGSKKEEITEEGSQEEE